MGFIDGDDMGIKYKTLVRGFCDESYLEYTKEKTKPKKKKIKHNKPSNFKYRRSFVNILDRNKHITNWNVGGRKKRQKSYNNFCKRNGINRNKKLGELDERF